MKHKKKTMGPLLAMVLAFALTACGNSQRKEKMLVAYFSQTGTTEEIAKTIAEQTGADLAEIERVKPYEALQDEAEAEQPAYF